MENRIIFSLGNDLRAVKRLSDLDPLLEQVVPYVGVVKFGLALVHQFGTPYVVDYLSKFNRPIFADVKLHDVPETIGGATKALASLGVAMFTVCASSGVPSMMEAVPHKGNSKMFVLTVLTSLDAEDLFDIGHLEALGLMGDYVPKVSARRKFLTTNYVTAFVMARALAAARCGADGVICSGHELRMLNSNLLTAKLQKATPGIRPLMAAKRGQKRIVTASRAILDGADWIIVGSPISDVPDRSPADAAQDILREVTDAEKRRTRIP